MLNGSRGKWEGGRVREEEEKEENVKEKERGERICSMIYKMIIFEGLSSNEQSLALLDNPHH